MNKATKTWKIGEYAKGGIITAEIKGNEISVIGKDWDISKGFSKKSDQSNAKEFARVTVLDTDMNAESQLMDFLEDLSTYYWANEVMDWIKTKVSFRSTFYW